MSDLIRATNNFSKENIIGIGRKGPMYKAMLPSGFLIAIKRFQGSQFTSELTTLGSLRHHNVVSLLGFCISKEERLLVYKYMPNGTLRYYLYLVRNRVKAMEWPLRLKISIGLARGLTWLHNNRKRCIVHGKICSKYVLFDENFEPKISNFRNAALMNLDEDRPTTSTTPTPKGDVFNFGVLLLELLTNEKPTELMIASSNIYNAIDGSLKGKGFDGDIFLLLKVARKCVLPSPKERPRMFEVYQTLTSIGKRYDFIEDDDILMPLESY